MKISKCIARLLNITLLNLILPIPVFAQDLSEALRLSIQQRIDEGYHLSTIIGVMDAEGVRYYSFGQLSLSSDAKPDENSIYEIGSITKTFTAILFSDLFLKKELSMDDSLQTLLPGSNISSQENNPVTLKHLLTHTSGLPREPTNMDAGSDDRYAKYTITDMYEFLREYSFPRKIENQYEYSNAGYGILGLIAEVKGGMSYEELITIRICDVLGMKDTRITLTDEQKDRLAKGFRYGQSPSELDLGQFQAMGGLRSTASDMLRFLAANLGLEQSQLFNAMQFSHQPLVLKTGSENVEIGLAWEILHRKESGQTITYHTGGTNGFVNFAGFNKQTMKAVVVLNSGRRYFSDIGFHILDPTYPIAEIDKLN